MPRSLGATALPSSQRRRTETIAKDGPVPTSDRVADCQGSPDAEDDAKHLGSFITCWRASLYKRSLVPVLMSAGGFLCVSDDGGGSKVRKNLRIKK